jgi:crotonobetaine/carnitine-CoA ligase
VSSRPDPAVDVTATPETAIDVLLRRATADPYGEIVRFVGGTRLTAADAVEAASFVAGLLDVPQLTGPAGSAVLTCLLPGVALVEVMFGALLSGRVEVPLAVDATAEQALRMTRLTGARTLVMGTGALARNAGLAEVARTWRGAGRHLVVVDDAPYAHIADSLAPLATDLTPRSPADRLPTPDAPAVVMVTSGTTGLPKAAVLPHFAAVRQARRVAATMDYGPGDVLFNFFPWNHINIRHAGLLAALVSGARLVAGRRFSASRFWSTCRDEEVTAFNFMGAVTAILERREPRPNDRDHQVRRAYGGPAGERMSAVFKRRFGVDLLESYACTELADVSANTVFDNRAGTAGRLLPEYEATVRDELGRGLAPGEAGMLCVRPRSPSITFLGYAGDPGATAAVRDDEGWISTGDRVRIDADGYLHYLGRRSDVVRRRGESISTSEVQEVIARMPGVQHVAVVGVDSELSEQEVFAVYVPIPASGATPDEVHAWCGRHLPRHAVPRFVRAAGHIPRNTAMKIDLRLLGSAEYVSEAVEFVPGPAPDDLSRPAERSVADARRPG